MSSACWLPTPIPGRSWIRQTQERLLRGARRWLSLTPDERIAAADRFAQWQSLPDERREQIRHRYQALSQSAARATARTQALRSNASATCPRRPARATQAPLREHVTAGSAAAFLTALRATEQAENARGFWQHIPESERMATRAMIDSFTPIERQRAQQMLQRLAPRERHAFHQKPAGDERRRTPRVPCCGALGAATGRRPPAVRCRSWPVGTTGQKRTLTNPYRKSLMSLRARAKQ